MRSQVHQSKLQSGILRIRQPDQPLQDGCLAAGPARPRHQSNASAHRGWGLDCHQQSIELCVELVSIDPVDGCGLDLRGRAEQDVEPLNRRRLVMAPPTQVFGVGPERFELREFEFDHLRWFSGTEVLNRSPVQPAQPADEFPTVVTLHCAPTVLRRRDARLRTLPSQRTRRVGGMPGARRVSPGSRWRRFASDGSRASRSTCGTNWAVIPHPSALHNIGFKTVP